MYTVYTLKYIIVYMYTVYMQYIHNAGPSYLPAHLPIYLTDPTTLCPVTDLPTTGPTSDLLPYVLAGGPHMRAMHSFISRRHVLSVAYMRTYRIQ